MEDDPVRVSLDNLHGSGRVDATLKMAQECRSEGGTDADRRDNPAMVLLL